MTYEIEMATHVTIFESLVVEVDADDEQLAKELADEKFMKYLKYKYGWYDFDEVNYEILDKYEEE
jgi:hypothetical protein